MGKTKVQVFDKVVVPDIGSSPLDIQRKANSQIKEFFPPKVIISLTTLAWAVIFLPLMALLSGSYIGGALSALSVVAFTWAGLMFYETYTPPTRTIFIAFPLSIILAMISLRFFAESNFRVSLVVIPVLFFVFLRININGRKLLLFLKLNNPRRKER